MKPEKQWGCVITIVGSLLLLWLATKNFTIFMVVMAGLVLAYQWHKITERKKQQAAKSEGGEIVQERFSKLDSNDDAVGAPLDGTSPQPSEVPPSEFSRKPSAERNTSSLTGRSEVGEAERDLVASDKLDKEAMPKTEEQAPSSPQRQPEVDHSVVKPTHAPGSEPQPLRQVPAATLELIKESIPNRFMNVDPHQFEKFVAQLFRDAGYHVELTKQTGDFGADLVVKKGSVSSPSPIVAVQVKRYSYGHIVWG